MSIIDQKIKKSHKPKILEKIVKNTADDCLRVILRNVSPVDFARHANPGDKLKFKHYVVVTIKELLKVADQVRAPLASAEGALYIYNGKYWQELCHKNLKRFLSKVAKEMGVPDLDASYHATQDDLLRQLIAASPILPTAGVSNFVCINMKNGTLKIEQGHLKLYPHDPRDGNRYMLPFGYVEDFEAPVWQAYLDRVQPNKEIQKVLQQFIGYLFIPAGSLKLEKALLLYGTGANGKSVFFEVVSQLLGPNNLGTHSLESITDISGYYRAMLRAKLANYCSEIGKKLDPAKFKQIVSGEPIEARLPYGEPFTIIPPKLIFNTNELPTSVENTDAFYRRLLLIPFSVTIPEEERDLQLAQKIAKELPGVFNWALEGLASLIKEGRFYPVKELEQAVINYRLDTDSFISFLHDQDIQPGVQEQVTLKELYGRYHRHCQDHSFLAIGNRKFADQLRQKGFTLQRITTGTTVFLNQS